MGAGRGLGPVCAIHIGAKEKTVKFPLWKGLVALTVSVALFFGGIPYSFAFVPFALALGFFYFFLLSLRSSCQGKLARAVGRCGIISFEIYLLHMYIVYDVQKAWNSLLFSGQSQGLLAYVVWLPIAFALSLVIGFLFHLLFFSAQKKLKHLRWSGLSESRQTECLFL